MKKLVLILLISIAILPVFAQGADRILGLWFNGEKSSKIEISQAEDGSYVGKIVWLKEPLDKAEKPKTDNKNPNKELRNRPLMELQVLSGLSYDGKGKYSGGRIYDPKSGKTYSAKAEMLNNNTLALRGFIGISLAGRTDTWIRTTN
jgi:uncharacterized protein (DUF2147 family)